MKKIVNIGVRVYPSGIRSYHPSERISNTDGFFVTNDKKPNDPYGVISFDEAVKNRGGTVTRKVGKVCHDIIKNLAVNDPIRLLTNLEIVHSQQLNVHFKSPACRDIWDDLKKVDRIIAEAIGTALEMSPKLFYPK